MGVSYHIEPVNKATGKFENIFLRTGRRVNNELNKLGNLMLQFPAPILGFFEKEEPYFDFIFSLKMQEISEVTFEPQRIKEKLLLTLATLKNKDSFPIHRFNYFSYEAVKESNFLNVTLLGDELNKISADKNYVDSARYDINTSFDTFNNYRMSGRKFHQGNPVIYVTDEEKNRTTPVLDLDAFPTKIQILKVERDYGFGKDIKEISLILKTPFDHFKEELNSLITLCDDCMEHDLGIKSYVAY